MAEGFNSLDPLGPQYGGNTTIPTLQNTLPFEGESLKDTVVKVPEIRPMIPGPQILSNPAYPIKKNSTGSAPYLKPNGAPGASKSDVFKAGAQKLMAEFASNVDKNHYGKTYSYNAGPTGQSFFKRYQALGQEKFDELGFTPFRNNEAVFNEGTSWWDRSSRMITHAMWPLYSAGFADNYKSLGKMMRGDFSQDLDQSRRYSAASAIGYDSKEGFGSFFNNTAMSFAYTAGIMSSAILEELAAAALAPVTGGASLFAGTADNLRKIPMIGKGLQAANIAADAGKAINKTLHGLNDINQTRNLFRSVGNFLNPLENLTDAAKAVYKNEDNFTGLARLYTATQKTAGGLYRDVRALNNALSEARMEGGMVEDDLYRELYNDFYRRNGFPPTDEQQQRMVKQTKQAGAVAKNWNTALIFASNKVVFPNIMNPKGGIANFLKTSTDDILSFKTGKIVFEKTKKAAADVTAASKLAMKGEFRYVENSFAETMKSFAKDGLQKSIPGAFTYFKANVMEGLQENAQEVISDATKKYYKATFEDPSVGNYTYAKGLVTSAIGDQFSAKGAETFASGLLMGAFAAPVNNIPKWASLGYNKIFDNEVYTDYKRSREKVANQIIDHLKAVTPKQFFDSKLFNYANQVNAAKSKLTDSEKLERDKQEAAFQSHLDYVLSTNSMDTFVEHIKSFKQMTAEEFEDAFGLEPGTGAARQGEIIDNVVNKAERMQKRHNQYKERFPNPINLKNYRVDSPEFKDAEIYHEAWEAARRNAVFFNESFENTASRMESIITSLTSTGSLKNVSNNDVNVLFDRGRLANEIGMLKTEIDTLKQTASTPDSKQLLAEKIKKLKALESFSTTFGKHYNYHNREEIIEQIKAVNPDITPEELTKLVNEKFGKRTQEESLKLTEELKKEFGTYLNSLTGTGPRLFNTDIDDAFSKFLDYYELDKESRSLVDYVNLLHDPEGYMEHVNRNAQWMKDLYNNRSGYYKDMVMKALEAKENNDLINHLANMNIYISADSLKNWLEKGMFPEEFYDDSSNTVITASNPEYQKYIEVFIRLAALQNKDTGFTEETISDELKDQLNELNRQKNIDLGNLVKSMQREDTGTIVPLGNKKNFSMSMILSDSLPGEYIEATYSTDAAPITYYNDNGILKYDDIDGEVVEQNEDIQFTSAVKYSMIMKADPTEVQMIVDKYDALRAELIDKYRTKDPEATSEALNPITISTPIDEIENRAPELYKAILEAFDTYFNGLPSVVTQNASDEQKETMFADFMRTSIVAKELINEYNTTSKIKAATGETGEVQDFGFMLNGKRINTADYATLPQLRALTFELEAIIDNLNKVTRPSLENINKVAEIKAIKDRIELLIKTRSKAGYSDAMKKAIEQIEQLQEMQKNIIYDGTYIINGKTMERVTRAIQKFLPEQYKYKYEKKVVAAFDKAITEYLTENPNITEPNEAFVDAFIENVKLKQVKGDGISTSTLKEMKAEMLNFIKRGYISREGAVTPIQNGTTTVTAPTSEDGMDQRWVFQIVNGAVISGKHTVSFNGSVAQEADVTDPDATYNRLRKNKTIDYVFNAVSTESPLDKFEILKEEVKIVVAEKTYEEATAAGNYVDAAVKQLFNGETPVFDPAKITQEAYDSLFGPQGHLAKIKEMVDTGQYYMVSTGLRVYDEDAGIAGEIDLLLVDQTGKFVIIDVKTGKEDKWEGYNDVTSVHYNKKIENTYQQAAYARILKNMFPDIDAEISILPIQITYNDETALITSVSRPSDKKALKPGEKRLLAPGKFLVGLDKNSVKEDIDKLIPEKGVAPQAPAQSSPTVRTKLYKLGFSKDMVDLMSDEDIAIAEAATDESEVKDLVAKYDLLTQEAAPQDDVVPVVTGEEEVVSSLSFGTPVDEEIVTSTITFGNTPEITSVSDVEAQLKGVNDMDAFNAFKAELNTKFTKQEINPVDIEAINELLNNKKAELTDPANIKLSESTLKAGDKLIVNRTIFKARNKNEVFADTGAELTIYSVTKGKVKFKYKGSERTLDLSEINDYFTTMEVEEYKAKYNESADSVTKQTASDSSSVTEDFLENTNTKDLDEEGKATSLKDALARLKKEREENCNVPK
jgi:hypothetical protein